MSFRRAVTLLQDVNHEMHRINIIDTFYLDIRYGLGMMRRNPGFTCVAVLTSALGTGANTAIFNVVNAVLLRSPPYRDPDRLVMLRHYWAHGVSNLVSGRDRRRIYRCFGCVPKFNAG